MSSIKLKEFIFDNDDINNYKMSSKKLETFIFEHGNTLRISLEPTRDDDPVLASSKKLSTSHTDKVTCASWIKDIRPGKNRFLLVTAGSDGKIFTWSIGLSSGSIEIVDKFLITLDYSGSKKYREQNNGNGLEIKCMSILSTSYEMVVGLDGGVILLCSLRSSQLAANSVEFKDPVVRSYEKHNGIVTDVCCCLDNMTFASCGTDSEVHIYNLQQSEVLHIIHTKSPLLGVEWTNVPGVLATWGGGQVTYYHVNTQNAIDSVTISKKDNENIVVLRMNKIRNGIVATGDQDGVVDLWMVPINESVTCGTAK